MAAIADHSVYTFFRIVLLTGVGIYLPCRASQSKNKEPCCHVGQPTVTFILFDIMIRLPVPVVFGQMLTSNHNV